MRCAIGDREPPAYTESCNSVLNPFAAWLVVLGFSYVVFVCE